ncbi:FapA family protein [Acetobacterium bakii]|uniref:Flagellar Assembly Protein A N-terminal region domain-containing protein n=1 Tax=Acetobacterium bakii TaxID=52689 RepID=A0A0L6U2A4_9FIRM|nr:FapA family protein [Acetobacterium bakii]KNZ42641.1 hypothetical protein AKG39_05735 [Acetobacterium bakii]
MNEETNAINEIQGLVEVLISDDGMLGYIKLTKDPENPTPFSKEQLMEALREKKICDGINKEAVFNLAQRPIFNMKINVAKGQNPIAGENGRVDYLVKRDSEYHPEYEEDGVVDYKNLNYFQMAVADQVLCVITKPTAGIPGKNILGELLVAEKGKDPVFSVGENTALNADETKIVATCDGMVRFANNTVSIKKILHIHKNVDIFTGNLDFSGDITIDGDVGMGFSVKSGGTITIKGVLEDAHIEAAGNLFISNGINGSGRRIIKVGKDLRCKYIEDAVLDVKGNITADYIIDSKITCMGDITLAGSKELINGGEIHLAGNLFAKEIGSERERPTKIKILGTNSVDTPAIEALEKEIEDLSVKLEVMFEKEDQLNKWALSQDKAAVINKHQDRAVKEKIGVLTREINKEIMCLKNEINKNKAEIKRIEGQFITTYDGLVSFKRKLYRGVTISFGDNIFQFDLDNLEHSKIYWDDEIVLGLL